MYYKVKIAETGRNNLREEPSIFNHISEKFKTLEEAKNYLVDRYGKIPKRTIENSVYRGEGEVVGFLRSFWNKDYSHNSKSWFQTDWVEVTAVTEKPTLLN